MESLQLIVGYKSSGNTCDPAELVLHVRKATVTLAYDFAGQITDLILRSLGSYVTGACMSSKMQCHAINDTFLDLGW